MKKFVRIFPSDSHRRRRRRRVVLSRASTGPFKGYDAAEQFVEIPQGAGSMAIATRLADAGVVRDVNSFRLALWLTGAGRRLQAGEYRFDRPLSARQVADKIARGDVFVRPITFPEGLTVQADGRAVREQGSWVRAGVHRGGQERRAGQRRRSGREGSRRLLVPRHLQTAAPRDGRTARRAHGRGIHEDADAGSDRQGRGAGG